MTRTGVMKHLRLLEAAGLVVTRRSGREMLHFLNLVPIRLIHDRWIGKYTEGARGQRPAALGQRLRSASCEDLGECSGLPGEPLGLRRRQMRV